MTLEEIEQNKFVMNTIAAALEPKGYVILLALMIIGYWFGNFITGFWWFLW